MTAVVDANIFILFARSNLFHLLTEVFDSILITADIYEEVVLKSAGRPGADEVQKAQNIAQQSLKQPEWLTKLTEYNIDSADASIVQLASECQPDFLLSDDRRVREIAQRLDIPIMGSGGLLIAAKSRGLIPEVTSRLNQLRLHGARISERTYRDIIRAAGEQIV